jgi:hypothetical protein
VHVPTLLQTVNALDQHLSFQASTIEAGGPGSGRHKTGISDFEKQSVMHLRRNGFKYSKQASVGKTHGYYRQDAKGNHHVVNLTKSGFTHSVSKKGPSPNFKQMGAGKHAALNNYFSTRKV